MTCHLEIGKKRRRKKQLQQGDFRRKKNKKEVLLYIQREGEGTRKGQRNEATSWQGISLSSCMLGKLFWNTKVGWRMVNSLRCYTQMHPCCHMNYSSPAVCTGFWKNNKKKKDFKAGLKDEWMRARIKGASKYEVQKKRKKDPVGRKTQTQSS